MTGAKLLGMHETVPSPTVQISAWRQPWWCRRRV